MALSKYSCRSMAGRENASAQRPRHREDTPEPLGLVRQALSYKAEYEQLRTQMQREMQEFTAERDRHTASMAAIRDREDKLAREVMHNISMFTVLKMIVWLLITVVLLLVVVAYCVLFSQRLAHVRAMFWDQTS